MASGSIFVCCCTCLQLGVGISEKKYLSPGASFWFCSHLAFVELLAAARGWVACAGGCLALLPLACRLPGILPRDRGFRQSSKPRILDRLLFLPAFPSRGPWVSVEPVSVEPPKSWPRGIEALFR